MKILVACEFSGTVRDAFIRHGHDAWSCDLLPSESSFGPHLKCDVLEVIDQGWDMMIAHPPCTYLAASGMHWTTRGFRPQSLTDDALDFVKKLLNAPIEKIALENPVSIISTKIRKPDQITQPYLFGEDASKKTCLWLKNLPLLKPTNYIKKSIYANQTKSGQNNLSPSVDRWKLRSKTYKGIADAMAQQWGIL